MQQRQRDVAALDAKYSRELANAKAENETLRADVAAGRRRLHIKAVCQSVREATTASGVDNATSPRLADTAERDYFTLRERLITMQNNWKEPRSILMSSADRAAHIDGQLMQLL
ncbi:lysis protein [Escherichia coli]